MKKLLTLVMAMLMLAANTAFAQKKGSDQPLFQEATAREATPTVTVFVFPQICDLEMLESQRVDYGPYEFPLAKDLNSMTNGELDNCKIRALQKACALAGADLIIEPLYTSTVYEGNNKTLYVSLSGYPAKYVNFRAMTPDDMKMIQTLYPNGIERVQMQNSGNFVTSAYEGNR